MSSEDKKLKKWNYENEQWTQLPIHLRHLPLITRHFDLFSLIIRYIWSDFLKYIFLRLYIRLKVHGDFHKIYKKHKKLLIVSNHTSHLDAVSIAAAIPFRYWLNLYIAAAKDYFFSNFWMTFFSKHCIGAIPIDRKNRKGQAVEIVLSLLKNLNKVWLVMFPEGTRSKDGSIQPFKKGIKIFSKRSHTPILLLYINGAHKLWPRNQVFAKPGKLDIYVGPVVHPEEADNVEDIFRKWVNSLKL